MITGWLLTWDQFWGEGWLEDLHELFATITMWAVVVHVSAVVVMGNVLGIRLIRTMITGKRPSEGDAWMNVNKCISLTLFVRGCHLVWLCMGTRGG